MLSTGKALPNDFIRSYAIVKTPSFVLRDANSKKSSTTDREPPQFETHFVSSANEGKLERKMVNHRHREAQLRTAKIRQELRKNQGRLPCSVPGCHFDFKDRYGALGEGFAEVHHVNPLKDADESSATTLDDLIIVCANCHAMIHRNGANRSIDSLVP